MRRFVCWVLYFGPLKPWAVRIAAFVAHGVWPRIYGARHIPRRGPLVLAAAHTSPADLPLLRASTPRLVEPVVHEEFREIPMLGTALRLATAHMVHFAPIGYDERNIQALQGAADAARAGRVVAIFLQGFHAQVGGGVDRIAAWAQAPVVPVLMNVCWARGCRHAAVFARRPLRPPAPDARSRRDFRRRLERRLRAMGSLRVQEDRSALLQVTLSDPRLWRKPARVPRAAGRIQRLPEATARSLAPAARALQRACKRLRCSVADLREPPRLYHLLAYVLLLPFSVLGLALCGPPIIWLRHRARRVPDPLRRAARLEGGLLCAVPWAAYSFAVGYLVLGAPGLLLPALALVTLVCHGACKRLRGPAHAVFRVRRHGYRLQGLLHTIDAGMHPLAARPLEPVLLKRPARPARPAPAAPYRLRTHAHRRNPHATGRHPI